MGTKIPLGFWIQEWMGKVTSHFEVQFRSFSEGLGNFLTYLIDWVSSCPPLIVLAVGAGFVFVLSRNWKTLVLCTLGFLLILNLGYWRETLETLCLVVFSTLVSITLGVPIGILCARHKKIYAGVRPLLDLMQTIPTFVYLIPTLMLFGLGMVPGVISTVIFSMPAPIRLTYLGISQVSPALLEVGDAFGATSWQRLFQIEIPHALTTIRAGISQCVMLSLSMVVIAALVGADGLGKPVVQALNTVNIAKGFEAGFSIVILAVILDRVLMTRGSKTGSVPEGVQT